MHFVSIYNHSHFKVYMPKGKDRIYFWNEMKTLSQPGLNIHVNLLPQKLPKYSPAITNRYFPLKKKFNIFTQKLQTHEYSFKYLKKNKTHREYLILKKLSNMSFHM